MKTYEEFGQLFESLRTRFAGRLDSAKLADAVDDWKEGEYALAIEVLCSYLADERVPLAVEDVEALREVAIAASSLDSIVKSLAACPRKA